MSETTSQHRPVRDSLTLDCYYTHDGEQGSLTVEFPQIESNTKLSGRVDIVVTAVAAILKSLPLSSGSAEAHFFANSNILAGGAKLIDTIRQGVKELLGAEGITLGDHSNENVPESLTLLLTRKSPGAA